MKKIIIGNLKENRINNNYIDKLSKIKTNNEVIILPNKEDLSLDNINKISIGTQNIIDDRYEYVLLGHKDFRNKEDDILINSKLKESINKDITVILCVNSIDTLKKDIKDINNFTRIIIAYEEDKNIGTSQILTKSKISKFIKEAKSITSSKTKVIYGGGINKENISIIKEIKDLDGILIGKGCTNIDSFISIINEY